MEDTQADFYKKEMQIQQETKQKKIGNARKSDGGGEKSQKKSKSANRTSTNNI